MSVAAFLESLSRGHVRVVDLAQPLSADTPALVLPEEFGQCAGFSSREVSRYDSRGVAWYWNEFSMNEHTGTHFDAPVHWVTGRDLPNASVDAIDVAAFVGPACVIDLVDACAADPDYLMTPADITAWEAEHGRIPTGAWVLMRTDWSKRDVADYVNRAADGACR